MKKDKTAAELLAELAADKDYVQMRKSADEALAKRVQEMRAAEAPLVAALRAAGVEVDSVWDLVNRADTDAAAIPVLFEHLNRAYPERVREGILRALAVPDSLPRWPVLLDLFKALPDQATGGLKFAAGCALGAAADESVIDDVIALVRDPRQGYGRLALIDALKASRSAKARMLLNELRTDPVLGQEVKKRRRMARLRSGGDAPGS